MTIFNTKWDFVDVLNGSRGQIGHLLSKYDYFQQKSIYLPPWGYHIGSYPWGLPINLEELGL